MDMIRILMTALVTAASVLAAHSQEKVVWSIGTKDGSAAELALGPSGYRDFVTRDFGFEDEYFLVGKSDPKESFPYVIPGPEDAWAGSSGVSGWRTHQANILFTVGEDVSGTPFRLVLDMLDCHPVRSLVKVTVNDVVSRKFDLKGGSNGSIEGDLGNAAGHELSIDLEEGVIRRGGNEVVLTVLEGSWFLLDDVRLLAPREVGIVTPGKVFVHSVQPADYHVVSGGKAFQPLLVDLEALGGDPSISVKLDGKTVFSTVAEGVHRYCYEVPMPAVKKARKSRYSILIDGKAVEEGVVARGPQEAATPADYVDTRIGSGHSRWMIAPGPWMPMSMVKLSPDNQDKGWQSGYQPTIESVGCFSHIHEWTMAGLGMMPTNGELRTQVGGQSDPDSGYRSRVDKASEKAPLGYYGVLLEDTGILAEMTATTRCSFSRYTFPGDKDGRIMLDLMIPSEYDYDLLDVDMRLVSPTRIEGSSHQVTPSVWGFGSKQEFTLHFVVEFDRPVKKAGCWKDDEVLNASGLRCEGPGAAGMYVEFDTGASRVVQTRVGISLVSVENALLNLETEVSRPFGWNFEAVVRSQKAAWNEILSRVEVSTADRQEKVRFYTNMYRAMCRNTWSDVNGEWVAPDETVRRLDDPDALALGCDAFWNTFWNLNQFWNLVTPEWSSRWVKSQLAMYDACGWLAKGPAGMKYIPVMVAEHEIPQMAGAWQMGIRDYDGTKLLEAAVKMQTTPATPVGGGLAGNRDLVPYLAFRYVPSDLGRFSNTLEYSFDDWVVSELAKSMGEEKIAKCFAERGTWWRNAINPVTGYAHMRTSDGSFIPDFDPFLSGADWQYVEGNAWQLSYFVPQDVPSLISIMGRDTFVERLEWGFRISETLRYNAPNDQYWDYPVMHGNQQSMHFAFLFNWAGRPWLTQEWSRSVLDRYYGYGQANAYLGDEDQGQMSAWFVMAALGLFQTDGGCSSEPVYEIASPIFEKAVIDLGERYGRGDKFVIEARGASLKNKYVQGALLNGVPLDSFKFPASELLKGGSLVLEMGSEPSKEWGVDEPLE